MKHARSLALVLAALAAPLFPKTARAEVEVSFEYFQEVLSPLGEWIEVADYGRCWRPTGVAEDWAPYTDGYWAYTDAGWTWVSYEDWGGITYHYGRWIHHVDEGWVWVPEYAWGPAWVSWRSNDDYVGWAPLPPEARWEESTGFSTWVDTSYDIGPDSYRFCHTRDFGSPVLAPVCVPYTENVVIIQNTFNCTNITFNRHASVVFCGGPNLQFINEHCHRPIPSLKLLCEDREVRGPHGNRQPQIVRGNQIALYAPRVRKPVDLQALPTTPRRVVGADKINRGWSGVPDLAAQQQIKERLQKQTAGLNPRTAPARPVRPADLSTVPVKAMPNAPSPNGIVRDRNAPPRNPVRPLGQPQRPVVANPPSATPAPNNSVASAQNPPVVGERVRPQRERPILQPQSFQNDTPKPQTAARAPQVAVPDESSRTAEIERIRIQREQQHQQENARRAAIARQQQEDAQRSNELRNREAQQQERENEHHIVAERSQRVQEQRQRSQADPANAQQQEAHRQQLLQQRQQAVAQQPQENASRAAAMRQQQEAAQRSNEMRRQQQIEQQQAGQRTNEIRSPQSQQAEVAPRRQEAVPRSNEMRQQQQQVRQAEAPRRQEVVQPSRPAPPPPQTPSPPSRSQSRDSDDDKKKGHSGR